MDEARLIEKLRAIEALFAGASTEGEKVAAGRARERIRDRLKQSQQEDPTVEYRFTMADMWSRKVFVALLRRYGIRPYRYRGQRYTTVMAKVSKRFVDDTLWPEFEEISDTLESYLSDISDRVVKQVLHEDSSEAEVVEKMKQLPLGLDDVKPVTDSTEPTTEPTATDAGQQTNSSSPSGTVGAKGENKNKNKNRNKRKRKKRKRH